MPQSNREIIVSFYAAVARADGQSALSVFDPAIVWTEAEGFPYADRSPYVGPAAVAEGVFFRLGFEWDNFQAVPSEYLDAGDRIVALGRYYGTYKATKIELDAQFAHIWTLRDGKIAAFQQYTDAAQAVRAVNGK
jgi:hypothetical protein